MNDRLSLERWASMVDQVLGDPQWDTELSGKNVYYLLCVIVVIFQATKVAVENLLRGGEAFVWSRLKAPLFTIIMIAGFPTITNFIQDAASGLQDTAFESSNALVKSNEGLLLSLREALDNIDDNIEETDKEEDSNWLSMAVNDLTRVTDYLSTFDDRMVLSIYTTAFTIATYLDSCIYGIFYAIASLWLRIIIFGAPIAFVVSLLTGGYTVFINWAKTYLAVTLWLPVAALIMGLINRIFVNAIAEFGSPLLNAFGSGNSMIGMTPTGIIHTATHAILNCLMILLVTLILKIIVLAKVPQIVQSFIGAGQNVAGGWAAAFIPVSVAKNTAVAAGAMAATGGAGTGAAAASAATKLKK